MQWLIDDIRQDGAAVTLEEANSRTIPEFSGDAMRACE